MYGAVSLSEDIPVPDKKALIVQGNYTGTDKRNLTPYEMIENYASLTSENIESNTDIVIYPETAIPINIFDASREKDALTDLSSKHDLTIITGFAYSSDSKTYNAVSAILPDGKILKPYCKQILVPFGEKIPFRDTLVGYIPQLWNVGIFSEGDNSDSLSTPCGEIGGIICYESIYPHIARKSVSGGAEVLVIVSNDSWFGQSAALYQHHSSAVLRAVENNRYVLRSSSTAITSAISPKGKVIALAEPYRDCAVTVEFSAIQKRTLYSRVGDIIVIPSIVIFIITIYKTISQSLPDNKKLPYQRH